MKLTCDCTSPFQDSHNGKGVRLMNPTKKPDEYRCTACGKVRQKGSTMPVTAVKTPTKKEQKASRRS